MNRDDEIFAEALGLPTEARAALLDRSYAGDPALRVRIESLLAAYAAVGDFLETPADDLTIPLPDEKPGDTIGRYTLIRKIGEGGCGTVYLAEQKEPVRRRVALKVIKPGMDTRQVIMRFEGERQALAMMHHPDIAQVFDAGATDAGRPYFVMEFVDGLPVTQFCDEHCLPLAARLTLFARACLALQHAHQKGVIHRDIKPSNILVARHDGVPTPKVIDFGIAKATQERLTEQTLVTGVGQFIGTPAYMSPEQADQRDLDIDTRSDVYSLGVLLYELLAGRRPFDPKTLARSGIDDIRRIIREVEPPRPSARYAALAATERATVASLRGATPAQLAALLRGELDWIVMRCLEKDRDRRYGTAQELADDVRRCLRDEPVVARPASELYRVRKFVARHRLACASAAALALTLIAGTVVSVRQAVRATRAERTATAERAAAQRRQEQAEGLVTFLLGDFHTELKRVGRLNLLDAVGAQAMAYFAALEPRDLTDTALARQAKALTQIGETRMEEARYSDAAEAFTKAYARAAALCARHPQDGDMLLERTHAEYWIGYVGAKRGDLPTQRQWFTRSRDSAVALMALEQNSPRAQAEFASSQDNLAALESGCGNLAAARSGFLAERATLDEMLAANPGDSRLLAQLADNASWLGHVAEFEGNYAEASERFTDMSSRYQGLVNREPAIANWKYSLASSAMFFGDLQVITGQRAGAAASFARARQLFVPLVAQDPRNREWSLKLQLVQLREAALLLADGRAAAATSLLAGTREQLQALVAAEPSGRHFNRDLATAWRLEGRLRWDARQPGANEAVARAIELGERLITSARADDWVTCEFAESNNLAGRIAFSEGQPGLARRYWQRALAVLTPRLSNSNDWRFLDPAAQALALLGEDEKARPLIERLHRIGYHPPDPLAASILDAAALPVPSTNNH